MTSGAAGGGAATAAASVNAESFHIIPELAYDPSTKTTKYVEASSECGVQQVGQFKRLC
eukprot:SAG11_NODE_21_length_25065_cov_3.589081_7_plen_59_part_00